MNKIFVLHLSYCNRWFLFLEGKVQIEELQLTNELVADPMNRIRLIWDPISL